MQVDKEKAFIVLDRLCGAYSAKEYPYNQPWVEPPQVRKNLPGSMKWGSRQHALFLFAVCYWMRGGIKSGTAVRQLTKLYETQPDIFFPERRRKFNPRWLAKLFRSVGLGFNRKEIAHLWINNLRRIAEQWSGDPRNIFAGVTTFEDACERIQNQGKKGFGGFQEKMVSMIIYFYMDAGIIDRWNFPIPVDFHALRTLFAHEIFVAKKEDATSNGFYTKPILAAARDIFMEYCVVRSVDPVFLCEAVWLFSGNMCNDHAGNMSITGKKRKGRKTPIKPMHRWTAAQAHAYVHSCGSCIVQDTCRWLVPSAVYYIGGRVDLRGRRDEPPQTMLFD